jgi:putative zinc finger protein
MTMHEHTEWTDKLSDYLDAELSAQEQRTVAAHVAGCAECARTLDELRAVAGRARALQPAMPPADLWQGIASRIASAEETRPVAGQFGARRRFSFTWPELVAASLLLVLISGWAALRLTTGHETRQASVQAGPGSGGAAGLERDAGRPDVVPASFDDREYDAAVADLQRALESGRGQLDPATVKVVEENLAIIDQAVDDARRALAQDPANSDLSGYLRETRRRKLDLLRHAAALAEDFN